SPKLERPVALAAAQAPGEAGAHVAESSGRNSQLLQNQGTVGRGGSRQWKHQSAIAPRSRLPRSRIPAAEGAALGRHQDRIRRFPESRVECTLLQIVVQSRKYRRRISCFFAVCGSKGQMVPSGFVILTFPCYRSYHEPRVKKRRTATEIVH